MKYIPFLLFTSGLAFCVSLTAQTEEPKKENPLPVKSDKVQIMAYEMDGRALDERFVELFSTTNMNKPYKGSPYLFEEWKEGALINSGGDTLTGLKLAYDVYEGTLICQPKNARPVVLDPAKVRAYYMSAGEETLYFERHQIDGEMQYLRTYPMGGGFDIYVLLGKTVRQANNTPYGANQYNEYVDKPDILYMRPGAGAPIQKVERNRKKFLAVLGEYADQVDRLMKIEGLKPNRLEDLKRMLGLAAQLSAERAGQ